MMKLILLIATALTLLFTTTHAAELKLTDNSTENNKIVREYIPVGTPVSYAVKKMETAGLRCLVERGKKATLNKGNVKIGQAGPMDFIWCDKQEQGIVVRRWQVIIVLDNTDKVKDYGVSTGLVGP
jgi:hypothetical protein